MALPSHGADYARKSAISKWAILFYDLSDDSRSEIAALVSDIAFYFGSPSRRSSDLECQQTFGAPDQQLYRRFFEHRFRPPARPQGPGSRFRVPFGNGPGDEGLQGPSPQWQTHRAHLFGAHLFPG